MILSSAVAFAGQPYQCHMGSMWQNLLHSLVSDRDRFVARALVAVQRDTMFMPDHVGTC